MKRTIKTTRAAIIICVMISSAVSAQSTGSWQPEFRVTNNSATQQNRLAGQARSVMVDPFNTIYVVWRDNRNGGNDWDIYMRRNKNGWQAEQQVTLGPHSFTAVNPTLMFRLAKLPTWRNQVWIAWLDNKDGGYEVYYSVWDVDQNLFLEQETPLSVLGGYRVPWDNDIKSAPSLISSSAGDTIFAFYAYDLAPNDDQIFYRRFRSTGWASEAEVPVGSSSLELHPFVVASAGSELHLLLNKAQGDGIYYVRRNAGNAWQNLFKVIQLDENGGTSVARSGHGWSQLDVDGNLHVVGTRSREHDQYGWIQYRFLNVQQQQWNAVEDVEPDQLDLDTWPSLAVDPEKNVRVFWSEAAKIQYRFKVGGSWGSINDLVATANSNVAPVVTADVDGNVHVVWTDTRHSNDEIYYRKYDLAPKAPKNLAQTATTGQHPHLVWDANTEVDLQQYRVFRNDTQIAITVNTSHTDENWIIGQGLTLTYKVKAEDAIGQLSAYSNAVAVTGTGGSEKRLADSNNHESGLEPFALIGNFPNPFNTRTEIHYRLHREGDVLLLVHNLQGQQVAKLVEGHQCAGEYRVFWNALSAGSGFYFYSLRAGDHLEVKRMLVVK